MTQQSFNLADSLPATPAERAILERVRRHPNVDAFLTYYPHRGMVNSGVIAPLDCRIPLDTHRYFLAHSPRGETPVLRLKDKQGLEEWRTREWTNARLFPDQPPTITDVTLQVLEAIESNLSRGDLNTARAWVVVDDGCRFIVTAREAGAPTLDARPLEGYREVKYAFCPDVVGQRGLLTLGR